MIFGQSKNGEISQQRHKTIMLNRSEPNFILNGRLGPEEIGRLSHPQTPRRASDVSVGLPVSPTNFHNF